MCYPKEAKYLSQVTRKCIIVLGMFEKTDKLLVSLRAIKKEKGKIYII